MQNGLVFNSQSGVKIVGHPLGWLEPLSDQAGYPMSVSPLRWEGTEPSCGALVNFEACSSVISLTAHIIIEDFSRSFMMKTVFNI